MKRELVEKGLRRMEQFYEERPELMNPLAILDENWKEAFVRAFSEFEYDELDYESKKWFEEDESTYIEKIKETDRNLETRVRFMEKLNTYYDELEQEGGIK